MGKLEYYLLEDRTIGLKPSERLVAAFFTPRMMCKEEREEYKNLVETVEKGTIDYGLLELYKHIRERHTQIIDERSIADALGMTHKTIHYAIDVLYCKQILYVKNNKHGIAYEYSMMPMFLDCKAWKPDYFAKLFVNMAALKEELNATDKIVFGAVERYARDNFTANVRLEILARKTGLSRRAVENSIKRLVDVGFLRVVSGAAIHRCNTFTVCYERVADCGNDDFKGKKLPLEDEKVGTQLVPSWYPVDVKNAHLLNTKTLKNKEVETTTRTHAKETGEESAKPIKTGYPFSAMYSDDESVEMIMDALKPDYAITPLGVHRLIGTMGMKIKFGETWIDQKGHRIRSWKRYVCKFVEARYRNGYFKDGDIQWTGKPEDEPKKVARLESGTTGKQAQQDETASLMIEGKPRYTPEMIIPFIREMYNERLHWCPDGEAISKMAEFISSKTNGWDSAKRLINDFINNDLDKILKMQIEKQTNEMKQGDEING